MIPSPSLSISNGFNPSATSKPSGSPSPSVSEFKGWVPRATSSPSESPSPSVSGLSGLVPRATSSPSDSPSPSVSATWGSVPFRYSCRLLSPSPSGSGTASLASLGLRPLSSSQSSGIPSPSESTKVVVVTCSKRVAITPSLLAETITGPSDTAVTKPELLRAAMFGLLVV